MKTIELKNFQCHKSLLLDLDPGVNVLVGPSDSGKSSVYRALYWIAFNRPGGSAFLRHGAKEVSVRVDEIERKKGKANEYILNGKPQKAVGSSVPENVAEALNLAPINFQSQHDSPFLLSETAGEVGRELNRMVDLEVIDRTLKNLNTRSREVSRAIEFHKESVREQREALRGYEGLDEIRNGLERTKTARKSAREARRKAEALREALERAEEAQAALTALPDTAGMEKALEWAESREKVGKTRRKAAAALEDLLYRIEKNEALTEILEKEAAEIEEKITEAMGKECPLCHQPIQ